jgi:hypothetical protein
MPFNTKTFYTPISLKSPYPLPHVLNVQLKYNTTQSVIISYLYRLYAVYNAIPNILYPFVRAATSVVYKPYYVDASPNASRSCLWCNA